MNERKELKDNQTEKVNGGNDVAFILRVVICPHCGWEIATPGLLKDGTTNETRLCPCCDGEYDGKLHY